MCFHKACSFNLQGNSGWPAQPCCGCQAPAVWTCWKILSFSLSCSVSYWVTIAQTTTWGTWKRWNFLQKMKQDLQDLHQSFLHINISAVCPYRIGWLNTKLSYQCDDYLCLCCWQHSSLNILYTYNVLNYFPIIVRRKLMLYNSM